MLLLFETSTDEAELTGSFAFGGELLIFGCLHVAGFHAVAARHIVVWKDYNQRSLGKANDTVKKAGTPGLTDKTLNFVWQSFQCKVEQRRRAFQSTENRGMKMSFYFVAVASEAVWNVIENLGKRAFY